jgi:hypothetical protein
MPEHHSYLTYAVRVLFRPRAAYNALATERRALAFGLLSTLLIGLLFSLNSVVYALSRASPLIPPLLPIPARDYYRVQLLYEIPTFITGWVLATLVSYAIGAVFGAKQTLRQHCALLGFSLNLPWLLTWSVDFLIGLLYLTGGLAQNHWAQLIAGNAYWRLFNATYGFGPVVWVFVLLYIESRAVRELGRFASFMAAAVTVVVLQLFMAALIR